MRPVSIFQHKSFLVISLLALVLLIISFVAIDNYILMVALGEYGQYIAVFTFLLMAYFIYALARAIIYRKRSQNKIYYTMAIVVSLLALLTFIIDKIMLEEIARLYEEHLGFSGEQRMLLVSLMIKFLAVIISALAAVKSGE
jgi:hypothetical protein